MPDYPPEITSQLPAAVQRLFEARLAKREAQAAYLEAMAKYGPCQQTPPCYYDDDDRSDCDICCAVQPFYEAKILASDIAGAALRSVLLLGRKLHTTTNQGADR